LIHFYKSFYRKKIKIDKTSQLNISRNFVFVQIITQVC